MPLKVRGLLFSFLFITAASPAAMAQEPNNTVASATKPKAIINPMTAKMTKIRAMIAARNLVSASVELEKIKKESNEESVQTIARTMLVGIYLEQPDFPRVKSLLDESFDRAKNRKSGGENIYLPVAGQIIQGSAAQIERYRKMGFSLTDANLPVEASADLDKWRGLLETVAEHARKMSLDEKKSAESLALLEETVKARGAFARDEYETAQWRNAVEDTREAIANAQTKVTDVDGNTVEMKNVAVGLPTTFPTRKPDEKPAVNPELTAQNETPVVELPKVNNQPTPTPKTSDETADAPVEEKTTAENNPTTENAAPTKTVRERTIVAGGEQTATPDLIKVGSLSEMATSKFPPIYPPVARSARVAGLVKLEVTVDEKGSVTDAKVTDGPEMLRRAALDSVRRWKFKPLTRDGKNVKMSGYINFNFTL